MTHALLILSLAIDLASIRNEPNLEHRSELALDYASTALDAARDAYSAGNFEKMQSSLDEVTASVDVAYQALADTGKDARRSPKYFKKAELKTRELLRRLDGMKQSVSVDDRGAVENVRDHVAMVHDELLQGIMSKKK
jgi:hypothetical protein